VERSLLKFLLNSWGLSRLLLLAALLAQPLPQALNRWDVVHYLALAQHGAQGNLQAFFPLWPALVASLLSPTATISSNTFLWAGFGLANFAFLIALGLLHHQAKGLWGDAAARWTVLLACFNPLSLFASIPYTEALYLLLTAAALAQNLPPLLQGIAGGLAAATRPTGVLLLPGFLLQKRWFAALLTGLGLGMVLLLGIKNSGDPFAFLHAQQAGWGHQPGLNLSGLPRWQRLFSQILLGPQNSNSDQLQDLLFPFLMLVFAGLAFTAWRLDNNRPRIALMLGGGSLMGAWLLAGSPFLNGAMVLGSLGLLLWGWGRIPIEQRCFALASLGAYFLKQNTISIERHLYATVPLLLLMGLWASLNPRWGRLLLGFGALLCLVFGFRFASGGWVG
jgi:Mannosyltransferase (PIG-V)